MAEAFSSALRITDLNDFIAPSQQCIKPDVVETENIQVSNEKIRLDDDISNDEQSVEPKYKKQKTTKISLQDCLACSGCVTSAETVLIAQQSYEELLKEANATGAKRKLILVTISPESRASLAVKHDMSPTDTMHHLSCFLAQFGIDNVFDGTLGLTISLREIAREFVKRYREHKEEMEYGRIPMLTSSCPGWVCYAEKTHGRYILPFIASTKSPQQIMGSILKSWYADNNFAKPEQVFHVTIMPCYDKKLEASRSDFYSDLHRTKDVDCVLTTGEIQEMMDKHRYSLNELGPFLIENIMEGFCAPQPTYIHPGGGSGGYLHHVIRYAAKELFGIEKPEIETKVLRNQDFKEVTLVRGGRVLLRFAYAYGFRNIQSIVQKLKRKKCPYDFVEIMACPSGCLNGGGQIRPENAEDAPQLLTQVEEKYESAPYEDVWENDAVDKLYELWLEGVDNDKAQRMLHTEYHAVEKTINALNIKW